MAKKKITDDAIVDVENIEVDAVEPENEVATEEVVTTASKLRVTSDKLGVRKGPGSNYEKYQVSIGLGKSDIILRKGEYEFTQIQEGEGSKKGWAMIGPDKWVSLDFCKLIE